MQLENIQLAEKRDAEGPQDAKAFEIIKAAQKKDAKIKKRNAR